MQLMKLIEITGGNEALAVFGTIFDTRKIEVELKLQPDQ